MNFKNTLADRLKGVLPHIDIAGTDFTIDWRLKELRETVQPWNRISVKAMELTPDLEHYCCYYDLESHRQYFPDADLTELPENIGMLVIPNELKLDPVGVAREYGLSDTELLERCPLLENLTGRIRPLSETALPQIMAENRRRLNDQHLGY
jgi:hypothetical protein